LVICPAVTWVSSITPIIHAGYEVQFCDINLTDFSFDYEKLRQIIQDNRHREIILWPTALIGHIPDFEKLNELKDLCDGQLFCDCAENMLSNYRGMSILSATDKSITSAYFSHEMTSIEMGFVFFKDWDEYEQAKMYRNHGMLRSLPADSRTRCDLTCMHSNLDPDFLFINKGTNLRPSDMHAVFGLLDFERLKRNKAHRKRMFARYRSRISSLYYLPPWEIGYDYVPFCLPIFTKDYCIERVKKKLQDNGIQTRPLVGSNLLLQPCFREYEALARRYGLKNADWVHKNGAYIGLPHNLTEEKVDWLTDILNGLYD